MKTTSLGSQLLSYGDHGQDNDFLVSYSSSSSCGSSAYIQADGWGTGFEVRFPTTAPLADGHWHYVVVTYDSSYVRAYEDGILLGTRQFPGPITTVVPSEFPLRWDPKMTGLSTTTQARSTRLLFTR